MSDGIDPVRETQARGALAQSHAIQDQLLPVVQQHVLTPNILLHALCEQLVRLSNAIAHQEPALIGAVAAMLGAAHRQLQDSADLAAMPPNGRSH